ncbi:MAG: Ig domain-containing protein [Pseudaminobacter sp.]
MIIVPQAAWYLARKRRQRTANSLSISGTPVTTATVGVAYAGFTVTAAGGQGDEYRYSVSAGALPDGISLDAATGAVSGTPTQAGTYAGIVIRATDAVGNSADLPAFTITVS